MSEWADCTVIVHVQSLMRWWWVSVPSLSRQQTSLNVQSKFIWPPDSKEEGDTAPKTPKGCFMSPVSIPFTWLWIPQRMFLLYTGKVDVNFNRTSVQDRMSTICAWSCNDPHKEVTYPKSGSWVGRALQSHAEVQLRKITKRNDLMTWTLSSWIHCGAVSHVSLLENHQFQSAFFILLGVTNPMLSLEPTKHQQI